MIKRKQYPKPMDHLYGISVGRIRAQTDYCGIRDTMWTPEFGILYYILESELEMMLRDR
jgi:hypothetical protein